MSLTVSAIDWLLLLFWHKKEKSDPKLNNPQAFKEGKQRPRSQLHASQTKQKKFQNDATTHKGWQGSKQAIGSSSSSSPRTTTIHMLQANHGNQLNNNQKRTRNRKFCNQSKSFDSYSPDSHDSTAPGTSTRFRHVAYYYHSPFSRTPRGCQPLQDFFRLRKTR